LFHSLLVLHLSTHHLPYFTVPSPIRPFYTFSLERAVQQGVVLDPLLNFCAVTARLQIQGVASQASLLPTASSAPSAAAAASQREQEALTSALFAERSLIDLASGSREVVKRKAAFIARKLLETVPLTGMRAPRAMVVVRSRHHVVWYTQELRAALRGLAERHAEPEKGVEAEAAGGAGAAAAEGGKEGEGSGAEEEKRGTTAAEFLSSARVYGAFSGAVEEAEEEEEGKYTVTYTEDNLNSESRTPRPFFFGSSGTGFLFCWFLDVPLMLSLI
jgi:hypothetical protein